MKTRTALPEAPTIDSPRPGCPCGCEPNSGNRTEMGKSQKALLAPSASRGRLHVGACPSHCFLPPDNPSDRSPGRGHQGHHPRGEPGPGIPGHRLPRQGGRCGVQPFGGWLHPCRTVSGGPMRHREVRLSVVDSPSLVSN